MERDYYVYIILAVGMFGLWFYHRKPKNDDSNKPRANKAILLGILFVVGMYFILKQANMLPEGFN